MGNAGSVPADYTGPARGITSMLIALTTVAVISRTISRYIQRARFSGDDALLWIAYVIDHGSYVYITSFHLVPKETYSSAVTSRGAVSLPKLAKSTEGDQEYIKNVTTALGILYSVAILAAKLSVLLMYRRIFTMANPKFRVGWWINILYLFPGWTVVVFTIIGVQIAPHKNTFGYDRLSHIASPFVGGLNALSDLMVLTLPVGMVLKLHLPRREKIAIISLFSLGSVATSLSIMRAARFHIKNTHHWNEAYAFYNDMAMSFAESSTAIICACLLIIKPLLRKTRELAVYSASELSGLVISRSRKSSKSSGVDSLHSESRSLPSRNQRLGISRNDEYEVVLEPMPPGQTKQDMLVGDNISWAK
ncbi:hypothetical protein LARI1_G004613 [Lachnellula arida]|uniref:Rhodopsin domain-containing protein n=1 Tax=Lachnellula arida TaxID=1316785 RepID=A0A8T9BBJ0_9HELO|nr:hypothetical protein LARI1_G004613 [Lachnellula arida]